MQSLTISADRSYIIILTNYQSIDVASSSISVTFRAGALISNDGSSYNELTNEVSLNNLTFMYSYI